MMSKDKDKNKKKYHPDGGRRAGGHPSAPPADHADGNQQDAPPPPHPSFFQHHSQNLTSDSVYGFYSQHLLPALMSSLPLLLRRFANDTTSALTAATRKAAVFLLPKFSSTDGGGGGGGLFEGSGNKSFPHHARSSVAEFLMKHFDQDGDGHIDPSELLNMTELLESSRQMWEHQRQRHETWLAWFSREWPLMDWKLGVFLWRTFGGMLLLLAVLSIVPGRLHRWSAKVLRWPVLGLTYFLIGVELMVYVVIRLFIRFAEDLVARPKHRKLRQKMAASTSYQEWHKYASALDKSQKRDRWLTEVHDETSSLYNWAFIRELMKDMREARSNGDSLLALAVIQQCTRKNVGGVMSEDLFCYSNAGDPKLIVTEFIDEVCLTLRWITDEAIKLGNECDSDNEFDNNSGDVRRYERRFQENVRNEKDRLWKSLVDVTTSFIGRNSGHNNESGEDIDCCDTMSTHSSVISENHDVDRKEGNGNNGGGSSSSIKKQQQPVSSSRGLSSSTIATPLPTFHHRDQVLAFLKRARSAYGRTALCLSGGAMMGLYHFGVVKALLENKLLPHIISGTSAGSVISAILCTRTDKELINDLDPEVLADKLCCFRRPWKERIKGVMESGNLFLLDDWMQLIKWFTRGDTTFLEAYRRTGKILCITLSATEKKSPPVLLNYLSAPNVTIASAVIASAAVPGFIPPVRLQVKGDDGVVRFQGGEKDQAYWDGSIQQDIPTQGLTEMLNCQFFVASQCNPHIVPFFFNPKGGVGMPSRWSSGSQEDSWRGGFLLAALQMYLKNDMKAKCVFLKDVEAAVGFTSTMLTQVFEGSTTIVPTVRFTDYFSLFTDPKLEDMYHYFQAGSVASYGHLSMISMHQRIANTIDDCIAKLENGKRQFEARRLTARSSRSSHDGIAHQDRTSGNQPPPDTPVEIMVANLLREKTIDREALAVQGVDLEDDTEEEDYENL